MTEFTSIVRDIIFIRAVTHYLQSSIFSVRQPGEREREREVGAGELQTRRNETSSWGRGEREEEGPAETTRLVRYWSRPGSVSGTSGWTLMFSPLPYTRRGTPLVPDRTSPAETVTVATLRETRHDRSRLNISLDHQSISLASKTQDYPEHVKREAAATVSPDTVSETFYRHTTMKNFFLGWN